MSKIKIGEHIKIIPGFPFNSALFNIDGEGLPLIRIRDLLTSKIETYYKGEFPKEFIIEEGDILIGMDGDFHIVRWKNKTKALLNQRIMKVAQKDGAEINIEYFYYFLFPFLSDVWEKTTATTVKHLSTYDVSEAEVEFPKLEIQTKIAKILSTADAVIEKTQAAIGKYKAIKQGMLQDLFTRGIDLKTNKLRPRFDDAPELYKESKLGWIPREWEEIKLGKCGTFRKGGNIPKYSLSHNGVGCILYGQLYTTFHETVKKVYSKVPNQIVENMTPLKYGAILFAGSGETHEEIGKCVALLINDEEVYAGGDVVVLDLYDEYFKPFFGYYLNFQPIQSQKSKFGQGSSVIHIYANHLSSIDLALPQRNEQQRIFEVIDQLNNKLQTEQTYLQKMQSLKKGLMEDLLSGKKCLNLDFQDEQINQDSKTILQSVNLVNQDADNYPVNPKIE